MSGPIELMDDLPYPAQNEEAMDDIVLYGKDLGWSPDNGRARAIVYGFSYQGHCYRLSIPALYIFKSGSPSPARGCGYQNIASTAALGMTVNFTTAASRPWTPFTAVAPNLSTVATGDGPFRLTTTNLLPQGLSTAKDYWYIRISPSTFLLADSPENASIGKDEKISNTGSGTHTITYTGLTDSTVAFSEWSIESSTPLTRVERRKGTAADLLLEFNLPGRSPASMTYSAHVVIASRAGKVHE